MRTLKIEEVLRNFFSVYYTIISGRIKLRFRGFHVTSHAIFIIFHFFSAFILRDKSRYKHAEIRLR